MREALAVLGAERVRLAMKELGFAECVVLSTCNRFEIYLGSEPAEGSIARAASRLEEIAARELSGSSYTRREDKAIRHLFEVAAGLDSMVVGETEVLGQVKTAYEEARRAELTGKYFNVLFQRALYVGKLARSETGISAGQTSVASVAVQLAGTIFGELKESEVMILGAGQVAESCLKHLLSGKVRRVSLVNRTLAHAEELARKIQSPSRATIVQVLPWESHAQALETADIVIASTGSTQPVLTREMIEGAHKVRSGRSLFMIDLAMPRDIEDSVHGLDNTYLYRLGDLEAIVAEHLLGRSQEVEKARKIVDEKAGEFESWLKAASAGANSSLRHSTV